MITQGKYYLVTGYDWFYNPITGELCKAAWGKAQILTTEEVFNFKPLRPSTNWFLKLGEGEGSILIAGCQVFYAVECAKRPYESDKNYISKDTKLSVSANHIYFTE